MFGLSIIRDSVYCITYDVGFRSTLTIGSLFVYVAFCQCFGTFRVEYFNSGKFKMVSAINHTLVLLFMSICATKIDFHVTNKRPSLDLVYPIYFLRVYTYIKNVYLYDICQNYHSVFSYMRNTMFLRALIFRSKFLINVSSKYCH